MGRMEGDRQDYAHPLLFGMRISARPLDGLEISVERTAQWCGEGRSCTWDDFWNLFLGNDNAGENVDRGGRARQSTWRVGISAGRRRSATGTMPIYNQHMGETIDNKIPRPYRSMDMIGIETWGESQKRWQLLARRARVGEHALRRNGERNEALGLRV